MAGCVFYLRESAMPRARALERQYGSQPSSRPAAAHLPSVSQGFIRPSSRAILVDAPTPAELLDKLARYQPPPSLIRLAAEGCASSCQLGRWAARGRQPTGPEASRVCEAELLACCCCAPAPLQQAGRASARVRRCGAAGSHVASPLLPQSALCSPALIVEV